MPPVRALRRLAVKGRQGRPKCANPRIGVLRGLLASFARDRGDARRGRGLTAAHPLLATLRRRGVEIRREGDRLRWRAPRGVLRPTDLAALRRAKAELLDALAAETPELDALDTGAVLLRYAMKLPA